MNVPFYSLDYVNRTLGDALRESFSDVLDSKWFIRGNRCSEFEETFAAYCGKKACVGVGNGLDALTLMLKASIILGRMAEGDEVIVPANTFVATVLAVRAAGLVPVLVEPDRETCAGSQPQHVRSGHPGKDGRDRQRRFLRMQQLDGCIFRRNAGPG